MGKTIFACNFHEGDVMQAVMVSGGGDTRHLVIDPDNVSVMKKVYCSCGCILDLDRSYFDRRMSLGKELECINCRNSRISREIDELNALYSGDGLDEDEWSF